MRNYNSRGRGNRGNNQNYNNNQNRNNNQNYNNNQNFNNQQPNNNSQNSGQMTKIHVRGWAQSKAASNPDGGISDLHNFLLRKAKGRNIVKSWQNNDTYVILVRSEDANEFTHLNGFQFAGQPLIVEDTTKGNGGQQAPSGPRNQPNNTFNHNNNQNQNTPSNRGGRGGSRGGFQGSNTPQSDQAWDAAAGNVEAALIAVIRRCYHPGGKFLNLQNLPSASEFQEIGLTSQPASKVFSALFVCCETKVFETPLKRQQMVESLSLSANGLTSVKDCISAAGTFNNIKNLDLSENQIPEVGELRYWRNKFPNLEHLILRGNPVDADPEIRKKMKLWYPKLKLYNGEPLPETNATPAAATATNLPQAATASLEILPNANHPQIAQGSTYGQPVSGKAPDQVMKEQMALRFSYETKLDIELSEQCLQSNNFDYQIALVDLQNLINSGSIKATGFWQ